MEWERGKVGYFIGKIEAILSQFRQAKGKQRWLRFKFNLYAKWRADVILGRVLGPAHLFRSPDPTLRLFPYYYNTWRGAKAEAREGRRRPRGEARRSDGPARRTKTFPRRGLDLDMTLRAKLPPTRTRPKPSATRTKLAETLRSPWQVHTSELCLFCN